jgi:hypothetical protein
LKIILQALRIRMQLEMILKAAGKEYGSITNAMN